MTGLPGRKGPLDGRQATCRQPLHCWCEARPVIWLLALRGMSLLEDWGNVRGITEGR